MVHHWFVPYEQAIAGPPGHICHPCVVIVLCVSHVVISPKLKRLAFSQKYVICYEIRFGLDLDLDLDLKNYSGYL